MNVPEQPDPIPAPEPVVAEIPEEQPDPFDYLLTCYTPNLDFGTIQEGDIKNSKQFSIVNIGSTDVPLTYAATDPYTSFVLEIPENLYLRPGDQAIFSVSPSTKLKEGVYNATYTFFSANDYRRTHYAKVTMTVKVKAAEPVVTKVVVSPGSASVPAGKTMQFKAEGQTILRHPEYNMNDRLLLDKIDKSAGTITLDGCTYPLNDRYVRHVRLFHAAFLYRLFHIFILILLLLFPVGIDADIAEHHGRGKAQNHCH